MTKGMYKIDDNTWINPFQVVAVSFSMRDGIIVHMSGGNRLIAHEYTPKKLEPIPTSFIEDPAELKKAVESNAEAERKYRKKGQDNAEKLSAILLDMMK